MYPVVLLKSLFSLKDFMIKQKKEVEKNDKNNNAGKPIFLKLAANPREANKEVVKIRDDVFEKSMHSISFRAESRGIGGGSPSRG